MFITKLAINIASSCTNTKQTIRSNRASFRIFCLKQFFHKRALKEAPVEHASGSQHNEHTKSMCCWWKSRKRHLGAASEQLWLSYTCTVCWISWLTGGGGGKGGVCRLRRTAVQWLSSAFHRTCWGPALGCSQFIFLVEIFINMEFGDLVDANLCLCCRNCWIILQLICVCV